MKLVLVLAMVMTLGLSDAASCQQTDAEALEKSQRQIREAREAAAKAGQESLNQTAPSRNPESLTEKASYLIGYNVVKDFRTQGIDVDMEQLIFGMRQAAAGKQPVMTDEEIRSVMQAFERKIVKQQQEKMMKLADENKRKGVAFLKANALKEGVKELESGVQYISQQSAAADAQSPRITDSVRVHYKGMLPDGTVFDSSAGGPPAAFNIGVVVKGFSEALMNMKVGDKWQVFIPGELGYGVRGNPAAGIGPNQTLIFEVELVGIVK